MRRRDEARVFGCASVLLSYPGSDFAGDLAAVRAAADGIPAGAARSGLQATAARLGAMPMGDVGRLYVETFDLRKDMSLHLTYYRLGDTRERGLALADLLPAYAAAGFVLLPGELPDFLPAILELAAVHESGAEILRGERLALEAMRLSLGKVESAWCGALGALLAVLGAPSRAERSALHRYRLQGPPSERVGLEPFAPPEVLGGTVMRR